MIVKKTRILTPPQLYFKPATIVVNMPSCYLFTHRTMNKPLLTAKLANDPGFNEMFWPSKQT